MKHKVGDKVKVKSLEWYNENNGKEVAGHIGNGFIMNMSKYCGKTAIITHVFESYYLIDLDSGGYCWDDDMFENTAVALCIKPKRKPFIRLRVLGNVKY